MPRSFPRRIVSLAPSNTEILYALGLADCVAAVTEYCHRPPEARMKPRLRGWVSIKTEEILAFQPDLVVTSTICQEKLRQKLKEKGIALLHLDPRSLEGVVESFRELGRATGTPDRAEELDRRFREERDRLRAGIEPGNRRPRVYCEEWNKPPSVSGNWVPELMADAGAHYFPIRAGDLSRPVSPEEITAFNPEIVILSICGAGLDQDPDEILNRPGWEGIQAVQDRSVYVLDDSLLNCPGPGLLEGGWAIRKLLTQARLFPPSSARRPL